MTTPEEIADWRDRLYYMSKALTCQIHPREVAELYRVFLALEARASRFQWQSNVAQVLTVPAPPKARAVESITTTAPVEFSRTAATPEPGSVAYEKQKKAP